MIKFSNAYGSKAFGEAVHDEFIYNYFVEVDFDYTNDLNVRDFLSGLFKSSSNVNVYARILENIRVINCTVSMFELLLNQIASELRLNLDSTSCKNIETSLKEFISKNKPLSILDLNCINYSILLVNDGVTKNISGFTVEDFGIILKSGDTTFDYSEISFKHYDKEVYCEDDNENRKIKSYLIDHIDRIIYLYC